MQVVLKLQQADPPSSASPIVPTLGSLSGGQEEKKGGSSGEEEAEKGGILGVSSLGAFKKKTSKYPSCFQLLRLPPPAEPVSLQQLDDLSFPVLSHSHASLLHAAQLLLQSSPARLALSSTFDLPLLLRLLAENYQPTAYHNFSHAFSLLLLLHQSYTRSPQLRALLSETQWFFAFLAALAHDLGHPATSNSFEIRKNSPSALLSHNDSVLEHMHLRKFWEILRAHPAADPLSSLQEAPQMKQLVTRLVLATDVAKHFQGLERLRQIGSSCDPLSEEDRLCVAEQMFHGCDIGNPCLDYQSYLNWAVLVAHEFNELADLEEREGLQVTAFLRYGGLAGFYQMQAGFCSNLVLPLWVELDAFLHLPQMRSNVHKNMALLAQSSHQQQQREKEEQLQLKQQPPCGLLELKSEGEEKAASAPQFSH